LNVDEDIFFFFLSLSHSPRWAISSTILPKRYVTHTTHVHIYIYINFNLTRTLYKGIVVDLLEGEITRRRYAWNEEKKKKKKKSKFNNVIILFKNTP
jgi:hypothetical protein